MSKLQTVSCVVLCGGKGSRMHSEALHKVCFPIGSVPAIHYTLGNLRDAGIKRFVVVLGSMAGKVMECISSEFRDVAYAYQQDPLGTGDAAQKGINLLKKMGIDGPVMIVMGDKIIAPPVIHQLVNAFLEQNAEAAFACQPKAFYPSGGRIVYDNRGNLRGIIEERDVHRAFLSGYLLEQIEKGKSVAWNKVDDFAVKITSGARKRRNTLAGFQSLFSGNILKSLSDFETSNLTNLKAARLGNESFPPEWIEKGRYVNAALYMFRTESLYRELQKLRMDNAQGEIYLTNVINNLANSQIPEGKPYKVITVPVEEEGNILSFNTVEELLEVEKEILKTRVTVTAPLSPETAKHFPLWRKLFQEMPGPLETRFHEIYGDDRDLIEERRQTHTECLDFFQQHFGNDRKVVMSRAPGRLNLMGRHVEHRGGNINVIAIDKEIICVAAARDDDTIRMVNVNREFEERSFRISDHLAEIGWQDWIGYLNLKGTQKMVLDSKGDWANYVKAAVIRLQYTCRDRMLKGMDMAFHGNIPIAAGLSSSSAVVVATAEATIALNGLEIEPSDFVDFCGEGEWFVGARKGAGGHAAFKFGKRGHVAHIGLFPFRLEVNTEFPGRCSLVVANSMVKAQKTAGAGDIYNQRIASYEFGFRILKERFPDISYKLHHLRDINPDNLELPTSRIYEMLMAIPEKATPEEIYEILPESQHQEIRDIVAGHTTPEYYNIRSVLLYGIAECERSRLVKSVLERGDLAAFGEMMRTSHNGDRVMKFHEGKGSRYEQPATAGYIKRLIDDQKSEDPERVLAAQLERQPGAYSCSVPETDLLVDIAGGTEGVVGAQLSGAGLGGCVMILVYSEALDRLTRALEESYYRPKGLESGITVCTPVTGSMVWQVKS